MNPFNLCLKEKVKLRQHPDRLKLVEGWRYQDFIVHQWNDGELFDPWRVSHLPTGMLLARFSKDENACEAMIEIAKLRNDWAIIRQGDLTIETRDKCKSIIEKYKGEFANGRRDGTQMRYDLNGYATALSD